MTAEASPSPLLVFGGGWLGQAAAREAIRRGGRAVLTNRDPERRKAVAETGQSFADTMLGLDQVLSAGSIVPAIASLTPASKTLQ